MSKIQMIAYILFVQINVLICLHQINGNTFQSYLIKYFKIIQIILKIVQFIGIMKDKIKSLYSDLALVFQKVQLRIQKAHTQI